MWAYYFYIYNYLMYGFIIIIIIRKDVLINQKWL